MTPPDHAGVGVVDDVDLAPRTQPNGDPVVTGAARQDDGRAGRGGLAVVGLFVLLVAPLMVALAALRRPQWFPILDLAMTELRVRDVGTGQTPLIGLPGRIGVLGQRQGSHPGPLSFWLLAPGYRLFGAGAWAMEVASVLIHAVAVALALVAAHRRGGLRIALGVAAVLAVLMRGYGTGLLTEPWNPYLPLLWWVVMLLAVWSVLDGDLVFLPVATFAGSLCAQTHTPYVGLVGGIGLLGLAGAWWTGRRRQEAGGRRRAWAWVAASAVLGAVLWIGPVVDQLTVEPGNVALLVDHFGDPPEEAVGLAKGVEMTLLHLDPWRLATGQDAATGSLVDASQAPVGNLVPGALVLLAWVASAIVTWRLGHAVLGRLHLVVAAALALATVSISRIFGQLWYYLMIWAWGIAALVILAVGWTVAAAVSRADRGAASPPHSGALARVGAAALLAIAVVASGTFAVEATEAEVPALPPSRTMAALMPDTLDALGQSDQLGGGRDGAYLVMWSDALYIGSQGIALVNELERNGFDVGAIEAWGVPVARHRIRTPEEATAVVHLATGFHVERWRAKPGVVEIATVDPRDDAERVEYAELRAGVIAELTRVGLEERLVDVDENLFAVAIDSRVPEASQDAMARMLDLGLPTSVFLAPVSQMDQ